jgi:hypothetical protein
LRLTALWIRGNNETMEHNYKTSALGTDLFGNGTDLFGKGTGKDHTNIAKSTAFLLRQCLHSTKLPSKTALERHSLHASARLTQRQWVDPSTKHALMFLGSFRAPSNRQFSLLSCSFCPWKGITRKEPAHIDF